MTAIADRNVAKAHRYMTEATQLLDAGFCTKSAQKRSLECLNRAYDATRDIVHNLAIEIARDNNLGREKDDTTWGAYLDELRQYDMPFNLHEVRDRHLAAVDPIAPGSVQIVRELLDMRQLVKDTPVVPKPRDDTKKRVEAIRLDLMEIIAKRREQYVEALDMARHFGGLPVSCNVHWVRHEQGTMFLRHYFYLRGKLTPLQVLLAAADTYAREQEA